MCRYDVEYLLQYKNVEWYDFLENEYNTTSHIRLKTVLDVKIKSGCCKIA